MALTRLSFFGGFRIFDQSGIECEFPIAKGAALISFLALSAFDRAARGELTALLWSEQSETAARTALRQCLYQMKSVLKNIDEEMLIITSDSVSINRQRIQCDTDLLFLTNADNISFPNFHPDHLLRGLKGLDPAFDEWLRFIRDECDRKLRASLRRTLKDDNVAKRQKLRAAEWMHELVPSDETAARFLIEDAARRGSQTEMLEVYTRLWDALNEGWDEEPSANLQEFVGEARFKLGEASPIYTEVKRKFLAVLALRLSTRANDNLEPEEISEARKSAIANARRIIEEHEGFVLHAWEEGIRAVFGLPSARETDIHSCIEAAISLQDSCRRNSKLDGGIGLDSGILLVEGSNRTDMLNIIGSPLDQAIFLSNQEGEFQIFATEHSVRRLQKFYALVKSDIPIQGNSSVVKIERPQKIQNSLEKSEYKNEFVGRESFLFNLAKTWSEVSETSSMRVINIEGNAGIGKTRLVDEFLRRLSEKGIQTARAICDRHGRSAPLDPIFSIIRSLNAPDDSAKIQTPYTDYTVSQDESPTASEMANRLATAIGTQPVIVFFDDWQWADDATRMTLNRLTTLNHGSALLIIIASRETQHEDRLDSISHRMILPHLTLQEVEEKAALTLDRPLERRIKKEIFSRSGGNPLFLEEICHTLSNSNAMRESKAAADTLPASMHSLIASRIDRLDHDDLEVVFAGAIHGDQLDPDLLSSVIERDVLDATYKRLYALDILIPWNSGEAPRFKHGIAREVAYGMIPLDQRRRLHLAYAKHLLAIIEPDEEVKIAEMLALHYVGGENREAAFHYSVLSGEKALHASSLDQAMWHYETALNQMNKSTDPEDIQRWVTVALRWAVPCVYAASPEHLPVLNRAEELAVEADDMKSACQARYWIGFLHFVLGNHEKALESLESAEILARKLMARPILAEIQAIKGCTLGAMARYKEAETSMKTAISAKAQNPTRKGRAPVTSVYTRAHLAMIRADLGDFEEADALIEESLALISGAEHEVECSVSHCAAVTHIWRGNWKIALKHAERALSLSEKVSSTYLMGFSRGVWGYAHWRVHGGMEGLNMLSRAASFMEERGMAMYISYIYGWLAEAFAESGQYLDAREACRGAEKRMTMGEIAGAAMAYRAIGLCYLSEGRFSAAESKLRMAEEIADQRNSPHERSANHLFAARLLHSQGKHKEASAELEKLRAICEPLRLAFRLEEADKLEQNLAIIA